MCSERGPSSAFRERPVDRRERCYCSVPESVQVILRKIQILSFESPAGGGSNAVKRSSFTCFVPNENRYAA